MKLKKHTPQKRKTEREVLSYVRTAAWSAAAFARAALAFSLFFCLAAFASRKAFRRRFWTNSCASTSEAGRGSFTAKRSIWERHDHTCGTAASQYVQSMSSVHAPMRRALRAGAEHRGVSSARYAVFGTRTTVGFGVCLAGVAPTGSGDLITLILAICTHLACEQDDGCKLNATDMQH